MEALLHRPDGCKLYYIIDDFTDAWRPAPTLIINTTGSSMCAVNSDKDWQPRIRNSRLVTIKGDAWHAAGAYPDACAEETLRFIDSHAAHA